MPRQLWNEGRVVGFSAYEVYVKQALTTDPNHEPATEKEWLSSSLAMGSSMILHIAPEADTAANNGFHYVDVQFPVASRLCAANTIMASLFLGSCHYDSDGWAHNVIDYGFLINNDDISSPNGYVNPSGNIPPSNEAFKSKETQFDTKATKEINEYMKIADGIIIQPGTWVPNLQTSLPSKDFTPDLAKHPRIRIAFNSRITEHFNILLTGFTNRTVVKGESGFTSAVNTPHPEDGDFLGPAAFPWAAKVIFSVPPIFMKYYLDSNTAYARKLPENAVSALPVDADAVVDLVQNHYEDEHGKLMSRYYDDDNVIAERGEDDAYIQARVTNLQVKHDNAAVLATYMHYNHDSGVDTLLPPALYAGIARPDDVNGTTYFEPVDTVAPGSLKLYTQYKGEDKNTDTDTDTDTPPKHQTAYKMAKALETCVPFATAFLREDSSRASTYVVYQLDDDERVIPVSNDTTVDMSGFISVASNYIYHFCHHPNGDAPDYYDLKSVYRPLYQELQLGYISDDMLTDYGVPYYDEGDDWGSWDNYVHSLNNVGIYVYGDYWDCVSDKRNYKAILISYDVWDWDNISNKTVSYLLVDRRNGACCNLRAQYMEPTVTLPELAFVTTDDNKADYNSGNYDSNKTNFLGSWWNKSSDHDNYLAANGHAIFSSNGDNGHKTLGDMSSDYSQFYLRNSFVPYYPDTYNSVREYYKSLSFNEFLLKMGIHDPLGLNKPEENAEILVTKHSTDPVGRTVVDVKDYLHPSFYGLSLQEILEAAAVKDLTKDDTASNYRNPITSHTVYIYRKDLWPLRNQQNKYMGPCMRAKIPAANSLFAMRQWKFEDRPAPDAAAGKIIGDSKWTSCDKYVSRADMNIWAACGQSGNNTTHAISLVDGNGVRLSTAGTGSKKFANELIWDDLLHALSHNETIDLLGVLKDLKTAMASSSNGTYQIKITNGRASLVQIQT